MNKTDLFAVGLKLLGFSLFFQWLSNLVQLILFFISPPRSILSIYGVSPFAIISQAALTICYGLACYIFISYPDKIAQKLFHHSSIRVVEDKREVVFLFVAFQGFTTVFYSSIKIVYEFLVVVPTLSDVGDLLNWISPTNGHLRNLHVNVLTLIIGIFFLLKAQSISYFLWNKVLAKFWR